MKEKYKAIIKRYSFDEISGENDSFEILQKYTYAKSIEEAKKNITYQCLKDNGIILGNIKGDGMYYSTWCGIDEIDLEKNFEKENKKMFGLTKNIENKNTKKRDGVTVRCKDNGNYDIEVSGEMVKLYKENGYKFENEFTILINKLLEEHYNKTIGLKKEREALNKKIAEYQNRLKELEELSCL